MAVADREFIRGLPMIGGVPRKHWQNAPSLHGVTADLGKLIAGELWCTDSRLEGLVLGSAASFWLLSHELAVAPSLQVSLTNAEPLCISAWIYIQAFVNPSC